jgi:hypothetical protein
MLGAVSALREYRWPQLIFGSVIHCITFNLMFGVLSRPVGNSGQAVAIRIQQLFGPQPTRRQAL